MVMFIAFLLWGCSDIVLTEQSDSAPVAADASAADEWGDSPQPDCTRGFAGHYANLQENHPDVEADPDAPVQNDPHLLDWWDESRMVFERYDATLDFGEGWWPVDEGFAGDPDYFAVRWTAWLYVYESGVHEFQLAASDDFWFLLKDSEWETRHVQAGIHSYDSQTFALELQMGVYPVDIRYAHRNGPSGLSFRTLGDGLRFCFPGE